MSDNRQFPDLVRIATGSSQQASYVAFPVAPYYAGLEYPREIYSGSSIFDDGLPFARLRFVKPSAPNKVLILTRAGVRSAKVATVTLRLPDDTRLGYTDYNGQAVQATVARAPWGLLRYDDVELLVRKLVAI